VILYNQVKMLQDFLHRKFTGNLTGWDTRTASKNCW